MIRRMVGSSQRFRLLVLPIAAAIMILGAIRLQDARVDVLPEFTQPTVKIQTEALGLSAAEVEQLVTVPLEQNLLNGVAWLDEIRSESMTGLSSIELIFAPGTDVLDARQLVQERLAHAHTLPNVSKLPVMLQPVSSANRVLMVELSSSSVSMIDQSVLARWRIKPRLLGIPGVANVSIWGQRERQLQVQVDPERLKSHGVTLNQVTETTANALWVSPLTYVEASTPGSGGFIDGPNQRLGIRHVLPITNPEDLAKVVVDGTSAKPLRLGDIAEVVEDHQPLVGDAVVDSGRGLTLVIEKFPDANAREVTREVEAALKSMSVGLTGITIDTTTFQPASFIDSALDNLALALLIGFGVLILLFGLLFFGWRSALIGLISIAVALATATFALQWLGVTFNAAILAGLVMALGIIIDDAVTGVDRITRALREQGGHNEASTSDVMREALTRVRIPLAFATLIVAATAIPLFFLDGLAGAFFSPMALAYLLAIAVATVVAVTVTPALAAVLLAKAPVGHREPPVANWLRGGYQKAVNGMLVVPRIAYATVAVLILGGAAMVPALSGPGLLPSLQDRNLLISWSTIAGTSRAEFVRITDQVTSELKAIQGVRSVGAHIGRAVTSDQVADVHSGQLWVSIDPKANYDNTMGAVGEAVNGYPGVEAEIRGYHNDILASAQETSTPDAVRVRIYGNDAGVLRDKADEVRGLVAKLAGVADARVDQQIEAPTVQIKVDLAAAQKHGLKPGDIRRAAATLVSGVEVGSLFEEQKVFDVFVVGTAGQRESLTAAQNLLIDKPDGSQVPLKEVAEVKVTTNPNVIRHDAVSRYADVTAQLGGSNRDDVVSAIQGELKRVSFPSEHHAEVLGQTVDEAGAQGQVLTLGAVVVIAMILLLQAAFSSWRLSALAFLTVLGSLTGAVMAAASMGGTVTIGTIAGFLAVTAIAVRWTVLTVRHAQDLSRTSGTTGVSLAGLAAGERFAPIVITALGLAAAMVPIVAFGVIAGFEVVRPLAIVVLGGLVTTTLVNLFVVPVLCLRLGSAGEDDTPTHQQPATSAVPV